MKKTEARKRMCPKCNRIYCGISALSRVDNQTQICPDCGTLESLESLSVGEKERKTILAIIRRYSRERARQTLERSRSKKKKRKRSMSREKL